MQPETDASWVLVEIDQGSDQAGEDELAGCSKVSDQRRRMNDHRDTYLFGRRGTCWRSTIAVGGSLWRRRVDSPLPDRMVLCSAELWQPVEVHTLPDWQPMQLLQNWRDVLVSSHTSDQTRRGVLDGLYASEQVVGDAVQKFIAVVQAVRDKRLDQSLSSIRRQRPDNRTQLPKLKKTR